MGLSRRGRVSTALVLCALTLCLAALSAQDWPQWRGPSRNGAAPAFTPPAAWPDRPKQVWKVQVGEGPRVADRGGQSRLCVRARRRQGSRVRPGRGNGQGDLARRVRRAVHDELGRYDARKGSEVDAALRSRTALHAWHQRHPLGVAG